MTSSSIFLTAAEVIVTIREINKLAFLALIPVFLLLRWVYYEYTMHINVPSVGIPPGILGRWRAGLRWEKESKYLVSEGMSRYGKFNKPFKIRHPLRWIVCITDPTILNELKNLPQTVASTGDGLDQLIRSDYTFYPGILKDSWHNNIIREKLPGAFMKLLPEITSEISKTWEKVKIGDEWKEVNHYEVLIQIVAKTTSRVLAGLPLSKNEEFLQIILKHATSVVTTSTLLDKFPTILQPLVEWLFLEREKTIAGALKYMRPILEKRMASMKDGEWAGGSGKPDDLFQWLLDSAPPSTSVREMTFKFLLINFASLHTTSFAITQALFDLATNPSLQNSLHDEIKTKLRETGGWTKQAFVELKLVDSVLRESARMNGSNICTMLRTVVTPHTFSDGTHVTKGAWVAASSADIHLWDKIYSSPEVFDGFRFYNMRQGEGNANKFQNVSTSFEYLTFGYGERACPGRFFATNQLKMILAYIVCNYEFKLKEGRERPKNVYFGMTISPDLSEGLLFRNRVDK